MVRWTFTVRDFHSIYTPPVLIGASRDEELIKEWVEASKAPETTQAFLEEYIYAVDDHEGYLERVGRERLERLVVENPRRAS
jgi:hypothetical protein